MRLSGSIASTLADAMTAGQRLVTELEKMQSQYETRRKEQDLREEELHKAESVYNASLALR